MPLRNYSLTLVYCIVTGSCRPYRYTELHYELRAGNDDNNGDGGGLKCKYIIIISVC